MASLRCSAFDVRRSMFDVRCSHLSPVGNPSRPIHNTPVISFPCHRCGEDLSVPSDLSGGEIQCPTCGTLTSVPLLSDLPNLRADGTHAFDLSPAPRDPDRVPTLIRSFGTRHTDTEGQEIDNRTLPDEIALAPLPPPPARPAPRYDPETGERIDALAIQKQRPIPAQPLPPLAATKPHSIGYATPGKTEFAPTKGVWMQLFLPGNALVLVVVWIAHVAGAILDLFIRYLLTVIDKVSGVSIPAWPFNFFFWLVVAHYGVVILESGEEERDHLPRPLRDLSFVDDVTAPLFKVLVAYFLAYLPTVLILMMSNGETASVPLAVALVVGGAVFPAMLLAACGSNTLENLRPDRLLRVMRACGWAYVRLTLLTIVIVPIYLWISVGINVLDPLIGGTRLGDITADLMSRGLIILPGLTICVYAFHGICWRLGQLQRAHHKSFGWAWEVHEDERIAARRERQRAREQAARARQRAG